jgi:hypothetical protein
VRITHGLSLCLLWLLAACAGRVGQTVHRPLTPRHLEQFAALDRDDHEGRARFAADLGLGHDATRHTWAWLGEAHARTLVAEASSSDKLREARRALKRASRAAIAIGREFGDGELVLEGARRLSRPALDDLVWGAEHYGINYDNAKEVLERAESDPKVWVHIANLARLSDSDLSLEDFDYEIPREVLSRAGLQGNDLRWSLLREDLVGGVLTQPAVELAATLAQHDRSDVRARVLLELRSAIEAGTMVSDVDLFTDQTSSWTTVAALSRARRRSEAFPDAPAAALHHAWLLMDRKLSGDALAALRAAEGRWSTAEQRELATLMEAMALVLTGKPQAYDAWREKHDVDTPLAADRWLDDWQQRALPWRKVPLPGRPLSIALEQARLRRVAARDLELGHQSLVQAWMSDGLSRRDRAWVRARFGDDAPFILRCAEKGGTDENCASPRVRSTPWLIREFGLQGPVAEQVLASIDVTQLDARTWASLEAASTTTLALSSAFTELYLDALTEREQLDDARAWLDRHGKALRRERHVERQLILAEKDPAADPRYYLQLSLHWPNPAAPGEPNSAVLPAEDAPVADTLAYARALAHHRDYAGAQALYLSLAADAPEPTASLLRGLGARAAFEAGDIDAAKHELVLLDPRDPARRELEALLDAKDGKVDQARETLLALWPRRNRAAEHLLNLGVSLLPEPALVAFQHYSALPWTLRISVERGEVTSLAELARLIPVARDPERAWNSDPEQLPPRMAGEALHYGREQLENAASLEQARTIATRLLAFQRRMPVSNRHNTLDWMQLTGQHEAALTLARREDPLLDEVPLLSTDPQVRLHTAGARGQLSPEQLWQLWRWRNELGGEAAINALLDNASGDILPGYACSILADSPDDPRGIPMCKKAWESERTDSWQSAVNYSFLLLQTPSDPGAVGELLRVFSETPSPGYRPDAAPVRDRADLAILHQNEAAWLATSGKHEQAAEAWIDSYAFSWASDEFKNTVADTQYAYRGAHARAGTFAAHEHDAPTTLGKMAFQALRGRQVTAALHYAEVVAALGVRDNAVSAHLGSGEILSLAPLLVADLEAEIAPPEQLGSAIGWAFSASESKTRAEVLLESAPEAALARLVLVLEANKARRYENALELVGPLEARFPNNLYIAIEGARARVGLGDIEGAKGRIARLSAEQRASAMLVHAALPETVLGEHEGVPAWARTERGFDRKLASISTEALLRMVPEYRRHTEVHADGFFPLAWAPKDTRPLSGYSDEGELVLVSEEARASRCEGEVCLRTSILEMEELGFTTQFVRTVQLPAGEATEAVFANDLRVWIATAIPVGGRVFTLMASAPHDRTDAMMNGYALLRRTFAPLDGVVPSFAAASLRADGPGIVDRVRLQGRLEAGKQRGTGCAVPDLLATLSAPAAAEVLIDLYLASPTVEGRRRVLACTKPHKRRARRLGLVALLDPHAAVHRWGRDAVFSHASRALRDAKAVIPMGIPTSAPDYFDREADDGARGVLELGLALPLERAQQLFQSLRDGEDDNKELRAWTLASLRPEVVADLDLAEVAAQVAWGELSVLAFDVLEKRDDARYRASVRARVDALSPTTVVPGEGWFLWALGAGIVELADPADAGRLKAASKRFDRKTHAGLIKMLEALDEQHAKVVAGSVPEDDDVFRMAQRHEVRNVRTPRTADTLADTPLAKLLPTRHWTFARVASPGLFASTLSDLGKRLDPSDPTAKVMVDRMVESVQESSGLGTLLEGGGLDLSAPIECARMAGDSGFVCSATASDPDALLTELGKRAYGSDAGLAIVLDLSRTAGLMTGGLSMLPAFLHPFVYQDPDEGPKPDPVERLYQPLRFQTTIAGHTLHYYAVVETIDGGVGVDAERYLFVGDRVFVFSNDFVARRVLFEPKAGTTSLGDDPEFVALTKAWKDGSALQAAAMGLASPVEDASLASEVVADGEGFAFRYSATTDASIADMTAAAQRLPEGAVSTLVVGYPKQDDAIPELSPLQLAKGDVFPPATMLSSSRGAAFGWYPKPGDPLWKRWALSLPVSPELRRAAEKAGARKPTAAPKQAKAGWWYAKADGVLLLASDATLLRQALARPALTAPEGRHLLGRGTFDGAQASAVLEELPTTKNDLERSMLRLGAGIVGLVRTVGFEATWDPRTRVGSMEGRVTLALRPQGASEVVDQWLAAARFRNAAALPRTLGAEEAAGTLRFTLAVDDAASFIAKSVYPSPRAQVRAIDDTHVALTVKAKATDADATQALTPAAKQNLLDTSSALRIHDPEIEAIRDTLAKPGMDATAKAKAITRWVHERIAYEVTPRSINATEVLRVGRGDCSEYALLSVSLLRSAGVPAEVRSGMSAQGDDMVAHAWVAYHDGKRWHEVDPTWGEMKVTAGHLPLEVADVLALVSLDALNVEAITAVTQSSQQAVVK